MRRHRTHLTTGFTLLELLIVISILSILMALLLGSIFSNSIGARERMASIQLKSIGMAFTQYSAAWGDFPEFDPALNDSGRAGSEKLYDLLCKGHPRGEEILGPYMPVSESSVARDADGTAALVSPLNSFYAFGYEGQGSRRIVCVLIDAGRDKLLGGAVDGDKGFVPDGSDANGDGKADHLDNIVEKISTR